MRALIHSLAGLVAAAAVAHAAPEAIVLPSGPFAADGERSYALEIYLVEASALARPARIDVHAARGQVLEPATGAPDGGFRLRYRPPRVSAPTSDTLLVENGGARQPIVVGLEPLGRTQIALEVQPDPLVLAP